jgi:hypothetical protein
MTHKDEMRTFGDIVTGVRDYDSLPPEQQKAFDAWWDATGYDGPDELDTRILDAANEFIQSVVDFCKLQRCDPTPPSRELLLAEAATWLQEVYDSAVEMAALDKLTQEQRDALVMEAIHGDQEKLS